MNTEETVDDFLGMDSSVNLQGGANIGQGLSTNENGTPYTEGFTVQGRDDERLTRINERSRSRELAGLSGASLRLELGGLDASDQRYVMLRAARYCQPPPPFGNVDNNCPAQAFAFDVALIDGSGGEFVWSTDSGVAGENGIVGRHWANVVLPLADADAAVDLGDLAAVEVRLVGSGSLWLDDVRLE